MEFFQVAAVLVSIPIYQDEFGLGGGVGPGWRRDGLELEAGSGVFVVIMFDRSLDLGEGGRFGQQKGENGDSNLLEGTHIALRLLLSKDAIERGGIAS
jgi:hypothetical protein